MSKNEPVKSIHQLMSDAEWERETIERAKRIRKNKSYKTVKFLTGEVKIDFDEPIVTMKIGEVNKDDTSR